ncbi:MAG TPA: type II toxin-antitoxin system VapC family toxin [Stellaceae bacterium]|nr:type II toxin-antitoxin system VapC family toxin [Stellaceae bacterium]
MRLLLDTSALLWWRDGSPMLPPRVQDGISDPANDVAVSIVSWWEIAMKRGLGKLRFVEAFEDVMADEGFVLLPISYRHLRALDNLPQAHRDPFDRMLIAQSIAENLPVVTNDRAFAAYGIDIFW